MTIKQCFPTLIYYHNLLRNSAATKNLTKQMLDDCHRLKDQDEQGKIWSKDNFKGGYTSYSSIANLHEQTSTFVKFKKSLDQHVRKFAQALEYDIPLNKLEIVSCWINVVPKGCFHSLHLHPLSTISGTFYLQTPRECGQLRLEDPRLSKFMAAPPKKSNARFANQSQLFFKPQSGKLILFESWLRHEVEQNESSTDRISVSFNYGWL